MKNYYLLCHLFFYVFSTNAKVIYVKSFGNSKNIPIIFLHGGPGYNAAVFEISTAQVLADRGFFVIVYDRRGEGRSIDANAKFTFQESFEDLNAIYEKFELKKAILLGHSFGGVIATLYAEKYPEKIKNLMLVSTPINVQNSYKNIIKTCKSIYEARKDNINLEYIDLLEKMDVNLIEYNSFCLAHAMKNGLYMAKSPNNLAKTIYLSFQTNVVLQKYASKMDYFATQGFWKNEHYTNIDLTKNLLNLKRKNIKIAMVYGKDDGLFSSNQINETKNILGESNVFYFENCSHNVFIDAQFEFLQRFNAKIIK